MLLKSTFMLPSVTTNTPAPVPVIVLAFSTLVTPRVLPLPLRMSTPVVVTFEPSRITSNLCVTPV